MFNARNVREAVIAKLSVIGRIDEAIIHDLYARAIFEELKAAHASTRKVEAAAIACVKVRHGESKWVMVDRTEWDLLGKSINELAGNFKL